MAFGKGIQAAIISVVASASFLGALILGIAYLNQRIVDLAPIFSAVGGVAGSVGAARIAGRRIGGRALAAGIGSAVPWIVVFWLSSGPRRAKVEIPDLFFVFLPFGLVMLSFVVARYLLGGEHETLPKYNR